MRINSDHASQPLAESGRSSMQNPAAGAGGAQASQRPLGEDQAQLSGTHALVAVLTAQVLQLPEIRQERVQALRQAVVSGSYGASSKDVASAMLDHWALKPAT